MTHKKVLILVKNTMENDGRVEKIAQTLADHDFVTDVFCYGRDGLPTTQALGRATIHRIMTVKDVVAVPAIIKIMQFIKYILLCVIKGRSYDMVHCNDLETLPIGALLKLCSFGRVKIIYDAHEYETERAHHGRFMRFATRIIERLLIGVADHFITVGPKIRDEYRRLYNLDEGQTSVVMNCPPHRETETHNIFREKFNIPDDHIIFLYQGGIQYGRGIDVILDSFASLTKDDKKTIVFLGNGRDAPKVQNFVADKDHMFYHEAVSQADLFRHTASADIGFCMIENVCLSYYYCMPNKFFEYTMAGLPVIISDLYELNKIIKKFGNGVMLSPNDKDHLRRLVTSLTPEDIDRMRQKVEDVKVEYHWQNQEKILLDIYNKIAHP